MIEDVYNQMFSTAVLSTSTKKQKYYALKRTIAKSMVFIIELSCYLFHVFSFSTFVLNLKALPISIYWDIFLRIKSKYSKFWKS